jgi:thiamine pyrophosphate-dependent acetolactate synthase large subunit-like protein
MLLGDLLTTVQQDLPIKIVVYDNGKLGLSISSRRQPAWCRCTRI